MVVTKLFKISIWKWNWVSYISINICFHSSVLCIGYIFLFFQISNNVVSLILFPGVCGWHVRDCYPPFKTLNSVFLCFICFILNQLLCLDPGFSISRIIMDSRCNTYFSMLSVIFQCFLYSWNSPVSEQTEHLLSLKIIAYSFNYYFPHPFYILWLPRRHPSNWKLEKIERLINR